MNPEVSDGGCAFPNVQRNSDGTPGWHNFGMTLRDYFAAKAMAAILVNLPAHIAPKDVPEMAYAVADLMLAQGRV
jgi:hypothetical protein